jgi:hypothetical protein
MKLRKIIAGLALMSLVALPMTAGAAAKVVNKDTIAPATIKTVTDKYKGMELSYPQVENLKNVAARHIINRDIIDTTAKFIEERQKQIEDGTTNMKVSYQVRFNKDSILSLTILEEGMDKGAAHGFKAMKGINYNYLTGEKITAEGLDKIAKNFKVKQFFTKDAINATLKKQAKEGKVTLLPDFKGISNIPDFYLGGKFGLDVYAIFNPYEIGPYASGIQTVLLTAE